MSVLSLSTFSLGMGENVCYQHKHAYTNSEYACLFSDQQIIIYNNKNDHDDNSS